MKIKRLQTDEEFTELINSIVLSIGKECSTCETPCTIRENKGLYKRCSFFLCKKEENIFKGTILEKCRIGEIEAFKILRLWFSKVPISAVAELTGISSKTIQRYRKKYLTSLPQIGGPGIVVEVDESKFGKRKYFRGYKVDGCWVLGMVERTEKRRLICTVVPDRRASTLIQILKRYIHPESTIFSDCWKGYNNLSANE